MAHNTSVISARVPNATRRKLHTLAESWGVPPSKIVSALLNMLPLRSYSAAQSDALSKILALLGLPDDATPDNIKEAINKLLGLDGLDGDDPDDGGGGGGEGAPETADPPAPAVLSEYRFPTAQETERVAARVRSLSTPTEKVRDGIRPAPQPAFVVDSVTNQVKVNPSRYARKAR